VEAPTGGSIILAGVLLKLGGYGLIRFNIFIDRNILIFFIYGLMIRTISCCMQLDVKRVIAYSSVSHMILIPFLVINNREIGSKIINIIIFSHAFSSIVLFFWVGLVYKCLHTRNLLMLKGIIYNHSYLVIIFIVMTMMNLNIPPFMGYFSEVFSFLGMLQLGVFMPIVLIVYFILSIVYMVNILSIMIIHNNNNYSVYVVSVKEKVLIAYIFIISMVPIFKMEIF